MSDTNTIDKPAPKQPVDNDPIFIIQNQSIQDEAGRIGMPTLTVESSDIIINKLSFRDVVVGADKDSPCVELTFMDEGQQAIAHLHPDVAIEIAKRLIECAEYVKTFPDLEAYHWRDYKDMTDGEKKQYFRSLDLD